MSTIKTRSFIKRSLQPSDYYLLVLNLIPVVGVWLLNWSAQEVFLVYCLESVIIGLYNIVRLSMAAAVRKKDVWNDQSGNESQVGGWFFPVFFFVHYGFFIAIQLSIFLSVSGLEQSMGIENAWDFVIHLPRYLSINSQLLLLAFVVSHGLIVVKDFVLTGAYKTAPMGALMFEPYGRIFVQQFTVIAGGLFLSFGAGKIFITLFAAVKLFFDIVVDYDRIIRIMGQRAENARLRKE